MINRFLAEHPGIELGIQEEVLGGGWEAVIDDRVDLVIGAPAPLPSKQGLRIVPYSQINQVFAVAPHHPLAGFPQPLTREQLEQHRRVVIHDSSRFAVPRSSNLLDNTNHLYVPTMAALEAAGQLLSGANQH